MQVGVVPHRDLPGPTTAAASAELAYDNSPKRCKGTRNHQPASTKRTQENLSEGRVRPEGSRDLHNSSTAVARSKVPGGQQWTHGARQHTANVFISLKLAKNTPTRGTLALLRPSCCYRVCFACWRGIKSILLPADAHTLATTRLLDMQRTPAVGCIAMGIMPVESLPHSMSCSWHSRDHAMNGGRSNGSFSGQTKAICVTQVHDVQYVTRLRQRRKGLTTRPQDPPMSP